MLQTKFGAEVLKCGAGVLLSAGQIGSRADLLV